MLELTSTSISHMTFDVLDCMSSVPSCKCTAATAVCTESLVVVPALCLKEMSISAGPEDPAYIKYQAESPDEAALVAAGKAFGFFFHRRNHTSVLVREPCGDAKVEAEYEILNILEFDSTRKRMSVICRTPEGAIMLYCKVHALKRSESHGKVERLESFECLSSAICL